MAVTAAAVRELHRIHRQLADLQERFERGAKQTKARETNLTRLAEELAKRQADSKAAKIRADQKQLQLKSSEDKIVNLQTKLNACATNREYQALKDQIAADKMACSVLSDEILEALEKIDEHQRLVAEAQKQIADAKLELTKQQQAAAAAAELIEGDLTRLRKELTIAEEALPSDLRQDYDRVIAAKGEDAMAPAEGDYCGGCHRQLTPNILSDLHMNRAVFCKNCGRLIYRTEDRVLPG
jgi:predicted  nucleic acid-binding Zn-ribbon protein